MSMIHPVAGLPGLSVAHAEYLGRAIGSLLRRGERGDMAFVRCLPGPVVESLCGRPEFAVHGWQVLGVTDRTNPAGRLITADAAVEIREDKGKPTVLLIDPVRAGAGMDGIYSATRELSESELLSKAATVASGGLGRGDASGPRDFARDAVKMARRVHRRGLSPWQEFDFYARCHDESLPLGARLVHIGLWPADVEALDRQRILETSEALVRRLLLRPGSLTPAERVDAVLLSDATEDQTRRLLRFLHGTAGLPPFMALERLLDERTLWVGPLQLSSDSDQLQELKLLPWAKKVGDRPYAWSGLSHGGEVGADELRIHEKAHLEVRWNARPEGLPKGSVEYLVQIVAAGEELASRTVGHRKQQPQKVRFTADDFEEIDENSRYEAQVVVTAVGTDYSDTSEELLILQGDPVEAEKRTGGTNVRTLVEGALEAPDAESFAQAVGSPECRQIDRKGAILFRPQPRRGAYRVRRPDLLRQVEESWQTRPEALLRWQVRVRADGTPVEEPQPKVIDGTGVAPNLLERVAKSSQRLIETSDRLGGLIGRVFAPQDSVTDEYIKAWAAALDGGPAELTRAHTVEVFSLSGQLIGALVLPSHPLRLAWQMAYDQLAHHARYTWELPAKKVVELLSELDGSYFPAMLPGPRADDPLVFGDVLGLHVVAMVLQSDREPRAAVSQLAQCLFGEPDQQAGLVGAQTATVLASEIGSYIQNHRNYLSHVVDLHALRPGDGSIVAEALTRAHEAGIRPSASGGENSQEATADGPLSFTLSLFPGSGGNQLTGRFFSQLAERRRTGAGGLAARYRWMLETTTVNGGVPIPRLRWSRRQFDVKGTILPLAPAHLSLAFDTFRGVIDPRPIEEVTCERPLYAYGLVIHPERSFSTEPQLHWRAMVPTSSKGERHPAGNALTDRLVKVHQSILQAVAGRAAGQDPGSDTKFWPTVRIELSSEDEEELERLHRLSDWVVTVDRHVAIEYFDSPRDLPRAYETYVIDCVPERDDLGSLQLITSTSNVEEVRDLLDRALDRMALTSSRRNCEFLLDHLKALSGRLAVQLVGAGQKSGELIALALTHANCRHARPGEKAWLPLEEGFFLPLDDVQDLARPMADEPGLRADLLYVSAPIRGTGLQFRFVEVKFRQHRKIAQQSQLIHQVQDQVEHNARRWDQRYFAPELSELEVAVHRARLARVLRFYAEKARRHGLQKAAFDKICSEIDRMVRDGKGFSLAEVEHPHRGYVFCPEVTEPDPVPLATTGADDVWVYLFGPGPLPDLLGRGGTKTSVSMFPIPESTTGGVAAKAKPTDAYPPTEHSPEKPPEVVSAASEEGLHMPDLGVPAHQVEATAAGPVEVRLGESLPAVEPVVWPVSIKGNPHVLMAGLPGMGKTTCLLNICKQLHAAGITPIVFSYHQDIDEKLAEIVPEIRFLDHDRFGFNLLQIDDPKPISHVDRAGTIRDIFAGIFPDFGEIQLDRIRTAIKDSYADAGWAPGKPVIPRFQDFFIKLQNEEKPDRGLMARLSELNDYGLFNCQGDAPTLLAETTPVVLRIHATENDVIQRAFASFILYGLYQEMFRRGPQQRITHAVIFDEAHRASRLKLLPTMAKECRKYGISLVLASQEARDFNDALYSAVANYLVLRVAEADARALARNIAPSDSERRVSDRLKQMSRYQALFFREGQTRPMHVQLESL